MHGVASELGSLLFIAKSKFVVVCYKFEGLINQSAATASSVAERTMLGLSG